MNWQIILMNDVSRLLTKVTFDDSDLKLKQNLYPCETLYFMF